jgi:hypothetical protein
MNDSKTPAPIKERRENALALERRQLLSMTPEKALTAIAEHPYPVTLVQSMAEEDFYLLVHAVGPDDAHPVLALASNQQWEYLLDMETWVKDRMDTHALTLWLKRLLMADPDRLTHWITHEKLDELILYLFRNIELHVRDYDQDPSEIDDDFSSEDFTYYVRLRPYPTSYQQPQKERDELLTDLLNRLTVYDHIGYRDLLVDASAVIPAEAEEELYRLHKIRMAEKGFLPFEEAVGVYQPLTVEALAKRGPKPHTVGGRVVDSYPLPVDPAQSDQAANLFTQTLAKIQERPTLQRLQTEFAGLCNQVIAADQRQIREKPALAQVVAKVGDYISLGMQQMAAAAQPTPYGPATLVQTYFLGDLFRVGYGCALALKWKADQWQRSSWFADTGLPLNFWSEAWLGVLGGLLIKKPLFYDNYATGALYREFATIADIQHTEAILKDIIAFDDLLSLMALEINPKRLPPFLTYQNLLLTLWANHHLAMGAGDAAPVPLTRSQFNDFFQKLWQSDAPPRCISDAMRERFLEWLAQRSGLATYEITERMGTALENFFAHIESELGSLGARDLDPRHIQLFLFRSQ